MEIMRVEVLVRTTEKNRQYCGNMNKLIDEAITRGESRSQIADAVQCDYTTVRNWAKKEDGNLSLARILRRYLDNKYGLIKPMDHQLTQTHREGLEGTASSTEIARWMEEVTRLIEKGKHLGYNCSFTFSN
jgi:hypothetical protein